MSRVTDDIARPTKEALAELLAAHGSIRAAARYLQVSHTLVWRWCHEYEISVPPRPPIAESVFRTELRAAGLVLSRAARARGLSDKSYRLLLDRAGIDSVRRERILGEERQSRTLADVIELELVLGRTVNSYDLIKRRKLWGRIERTFGTWARFAEWRARREAA